MVRFFSKIGNAVRCAVILAIVTGGAVYATYSFTQIRNNDYHDQRSKVTQGVYGYGARLAAERKFDEENPPPVYLTDTGAKSIWVIVMGGYVCFVAIVQLIAGNRTGSG